MEDYPRCLGANAINWTCLGFRNATFQNLMCSSNQQFLFGGFFLLRSETLQCQNRIQEKHHSLILDRRLRRSHLSGAHQSNVVRAFGIQLDVLQLQQSRFFFCNDRTCWWNVSCSLMSCHGAGASRCNKARSWRHCLANSCVRKHELVGKVAWFVSGLWYSRIWNSCLFWFCQAGNTEWLWTGGFEKNTPGFSDHVTSRPIIQRAVGLYGFLQSSSQFIWSERCLVQDLVTFFSMVFSLLVSLVSFSLIPSAKKIRVFEMRPIGLFLRSSNYWELQSVIWQLLCWSASEWDPATLGRSGKSSKRWGFPFFLAKTYPKCSKLLY